jgi:hypothetical protein
MLSGTAEIFITFHRPPAGSGFADLPAIAQLGHDLLEISGLVGLMATVQRPTSPSKVNFCAVCALTPNGIPAHRKHTARAPTRNAPPGRLI